jgi:hypothetical protein
MVNINDIEINELFCKVGLYDNIFTETNVNPSFAKLLTLISSEIKFDCYCNECEKERTFISVEGDTNL